MAGLKTHSMKETNDFIIPKSWILCSRSLEYH